MHAKCMLESSRIYVKARKWDDVEKIRNVRKYNYMKKETEHNWFEIKPTSR